jgi:hypothetical protein
MLRRVMNRAAARLRVLYPNDGDQARLVTETGLHQSYVSRLYRGERVPAARTRLLFWERPERIPMHWWDEEVADDYVEPEGVPAELLRPSPMPEDDEPTLPELPVLLAPRRQSSAPPPPLDVPDAEFQTKSRDWFDQVLISKLADAAAVDDDTLPSELPNSTPGNLPPVATQRPSERDRTPTDPDPRAGDVLEPTPKPLTALDLDFE